MDKTHYERRSHEQGNYEITPTYTGSTSEEPGLVQDEPVSPVGGGTTPRT